MAYIYCITNKLNEKKYVGKTTNTVDYRWKEHCSDCFKSRCNKRPLYDAMVKYGIENFSIETLEECHEEFLARRIKNNIEQWRIYYPGKKKYKFISNWKSIPSDKYKIEI